jgi:hypothetical protein
VKRAFVTSLLCFGLSWLTAYGPRAHIPPRPVVVPGALTGSDSGAVLARALAPLLYVERDEWFPLEHVVAVLHPPIAQTLRPETPPIRREARDQPT